MRGFIKTLEELESRFDNAAIQNLPDEAVETIRQQAEEFRAPGGALHGLEGEVEYMEERCKLLETKH